MEDKKQALEEALKKLNGEQLARFMWITVARTAPFYSKDFIKASDKNGYLTLLFLSLETCRYFCDFQRIITLTDLYLTRDSEGAIAHDRESAIARDRESAIARDLYSALARTREGVLALDLALAHALNCTLARAFDRARALDRALDLAHALDHDLDIHIIDLMLEDATLLREGCSNKLNNHTGWYGENWNKWLNTLNKLGGGYWTDWYVRLFENRFRIMDDEEIKRHLSFPKEFWGKELSVSAQWLMNLARQGAKRFNEARIILLGEKGAGKTSLARRLIDPYAPMPDKNESTKGVEVTSVKLSKMAEGIPGNRDANVHIWDFAGHAITHAAHRFFLSERCLYIIIYDGRTEGRNRLNYWLDHVRNFGGNSRVLILVNLQDENIPEIPENYITERYAENKCTFESFSIKDNKEELLSFRKKLADIIATDPAWDQDIPVEHYDVKEQLEKIFAKERKNHITRQEFDKIAGEIADNERDTLLKSLSSLGICLWYPNIKDIDLLVLNPEWITKGVYSIINWLRKKRRTSASIKLHELEQVFNTMEEDYPKDKHKFLYRLMQNYELAYKIAYKEQIVVPQCLPEDKPKKAKLPEFPLETSLYVEVTACKSINGESRVTFPPDILPRFIVRRSGDIRNCPIWRYGAVLKQGGVTALIEQDDFLIQLHVKGNECRDYLGELLNTLMAVFNDYTSFILEKPEISCRIIPRDGGQIEMIPMVQVANYVEYMEEKNESSYFDHGRKIDIPLHGARMYLTNEIMEEIRRMQKQNININQVIIGDVRSATATQKSGINADELIRLINNLKAVVPPQASEDDINMIKESVEAVEEEFKKENPRKGFINTLLNGLKAIKGTAEFAAAVMAIIQFVGTIKF